MANIVELEIINYRGVRSFFQKFNRDIICLVGRGDSGKTTILEAIRSVLSPSWNLAFYDTDFYELNSERPIQITVSVSDVPEELISEKKFGLWVRTICRATGVVTDNIANGDVHVLTIKLTVGSDLEPKWTILNGRKDQEIEISASDRSKFNCFMVSDFIDRHFSWNKGNPLNSLLKQHEVEAEKDKIILAAIRGAKEKIDNADFVHLSGVMGVVKEQAAKLGLNLDGVQTTLDFKDISINETKVSLHKHEVPFRLMGKGSKRLASMAIQTAIARDGGIALIDEIEQGLEPDRARQVARTLKESNEGQVIITTHSREVVIELEAKDLLIVNVNRDNGEVRSKFLDMDDSALQGAIRACPEAFFSQKVIVCEGATEVGVCRALDAFMIQRDKGPMAFKDCAYIDGHGHSCTERASKTRLAGLEVCLLCDSDYDNSLKPSKKDLFELGIEVFDCCPGNSIEDQAFFDLPWNAINELLEYVAIAHRKDHYSLTDAVRSKYVGNFPEDWKHCDSEAMRIALAKASVVKGGEWFKRVDHGEKLGQVIFKYFDDITGTKLHQALSGLAKWIE